MNCLDVQMPEPRSLQRELFSDIEAEHSQIRK